MGVGLWQDQSSAAVARRTDGTKDIGPFVTLIAQRRWTAAPPGPDIGQRALLADSGFILPPEFDRLVASGLRNRIRNKLVEVFFMRLLRVWIGFGMARADRDMAEIQSGQPLTDTSLMHDDA